MGDETVNRNDLPKQNAEVARFRSILVCPFPVTVTSMPGWDLVVTLGIRALCPVSSLFRDTHVAFGSPAKFQSSFMKSDAGLRIENSDQPIF